VSRGVPNGRIFLTFYRDKCAIFQYFSLFESMGVS
jgi:hypothetical protein